MDWQRYRRTFEKHRKAIVTGVTGLLYVAGWSVGYSTGYDLASAAVLVLATAVGGFDIAKKAYYTLRSGTVGINTLVTLAAIGAIAIGEYWEAAAVVFLFSLGGYLEGRTMRKTRSALQELLELTPDTATVRRDGDWLEVPARDVEVGEVVLVRPGGNVPVDGDVVDGESSVNQAPVTGESAPVRKTPGDEVYAGTVNQDGAIEVRATGTGSETTLQRIIRRVKEAQEAKSPTASLVDRFAAYYTPGIILLAAAAFVVTRDALLSLTLLVIGCPGALVIGPPVSVVSAVGNAARNGVLMKGGEHLERAGKIDLVAFDKTGTLTRGEATVADVAGFDADEDAVLQTAAVAEKRSEHHLAGAILDAARERDEGAVADGGLEAVHAESSPASPIPDPDSFEVVAGKGVVAAHDGRTIAVGNHALVEERGLDVPAALREYVESRESRGETVVYVSVDGSAIGAIALRDEIRDAAARVVEELRSSGVRTVMLTGDNERTARAVADEVGIDDYRAELLPEDKQAAIRDLMDEGHVVAMVGDGINDAPGLATADVGVAMGAAGTDTAIETADMALMADELDRIPYAVGLSKATRRNVMENIAIAVLTVGLLLAGVLGSYVHLAGGMLVHEGSVLAVILNGMRLLRY